MGRVPGPSQGPISSIVRCVGLTMTTTPTCLVPPGRSASPRSCAEGCPTAPLREPLAEEPSDGASDFAAAEALRGGAARPRAATGFEAATRACFVRFGALPASAADCGVGDESEGAGAASCEYAVSSRGVEASDAVAALDAVAASGAVAALGAVAASGAVARGTPVRKAVSLSG